MKMDSYHFSFGDEAPIADVRDALLLAAYLTEELHGRAQARLDAEFLLDVERRTCAIDAATSVGRAIAQIFTSLLVRRLGEDAFEVERVGEPRLGGQVRAGGEQP